MKAVNFQYDDLGQVLFDPSRRAKNIIIYVHSPDRVQVAVPTGVSLNQARKFVDLRMSWIKKQQAALCVQQEHKQQFLPGENFDYRCAAINLIDRLNHFARKHKLFYNKVTIRNQKTRWDSCSSSNNISLNIKLVHLPAELIDYVLLHELTHLKVRNHSKSFWSHLSSICPNPKTFDRKLRQYGFLFT